MRIKIATAIIPTPTPAPTTGATGGGQHTGGRQHAPPIPP